MEKSQKLYTYLSEDQEFKDTFKKLVDGITEVTSDKDTALSVLMGWIASRFESQEQLIATMESVKFMSIARTNMQFIQMLQKTGSANEKNPLAA